MKINFTVHNIAVTPPLRDYAEEKLIRLKKHFNRIINVDIIFSVEKLSQIVKATISAPGAKFHADSSSEDMYNSIDALVDKLDRQIKDHKKKHNDNHRAGTAE